MKTNPFQFAFKDGFEVRCLVKYSAIYFIAAGFVLPMFTLLGYFVEVSRAAMRGQTEAPVFSDYVELTKIGVKPGGVLGFLLVAPFVVVTAVFYPNPTLQLLVSIPIALSVYYIAPAVFVEFAKQEYITKISPRNIADAVFSFEYFFGFLTGVGVYFSSVVLGVLISFSLIGLVFLPGFVLAGMIGAMYCWACGYGDSVTP